MNYEEMNKIYHGIQELRDSTDQPEVRRICESAIQLIDVLSDTVDGLQHELDYAEDELNYLASQGHGVDHFSYLR